MRLDGSKDFSTPFQIDLGDPEEKKKRKQMVPLYSRGVEAEKIISPFAERQLQTVRVRQWLRG